MKHIISSYKIKLVKEKSKKYECDNIISSPMSIDIVAREVLEVDTECEEVCIVLALDTKNKIIGTFEISRGSINCSIIHPREIFKRLILLNANRFVFLHNHPSGNVEPSFEDINISEQLKKCGELIGIELVDSCIIGNEILSLKQEEMI